MAVTSDKLGKGLRLECEGGVPVRERGDSRVRLSRMYSSSGIKEK